MKITELQTTKLSPNLKASVEQLQFIPGIWVNGKCLWLQSCTEKVIYDEEIIVKVKQEQIHSKIRFSSIYVSNRSRHTKKIKVLAMHHFSNVGQDYLTFVSPADNRIFHHGHDHVYLVNADTYEFGMKEYTATPQWNVYTDRIWSSLQKGNLKYQPMAKGPAASVLAMDMSIHPHETGKITTWTIVGANKSELISMEKGLLKNPLAFPFEK